MGRKLMLCLMLSSCGAEYLPPAVGGLDAGPPPVVDAGLDDAGPPPCHMGGDCPPSSCIDTVNNAELSCWNSCGPYNQTCADNCATVATQQRLGCAAENCC